MMYITVHRDSLLRPSTEHFTVNDEGDYKHYKSHKDSLKDCK